MSKLRLKDGRLEVRVSEAERAAFERAASRLGLTLSSWVRQSLIDVATEAGCKPAYARVSKERSWVP